MTEEERVLTPEKKKEMEEYEKSIEQAKELLTGKKRQSFDANSKEDMEKAKSIAEKQIQKIEEKTEGEELVSDIKERASLIASQKTNVEVEPSDLSLKSAEAIIKLSQKSKEPQEPSGNAPLEGQYGKSQTDLFKRSWTSHKEMIDFLHKMERNRDNPEGQKIAKAVLQKLVQNAWELRKEPKAPQGTTTGEFTIEQLTTKKKQSENQVGMEYT
jgi:hypothetical protein